MSEPNQDVLLNLRWRELVPFAVAVVSGAIGGCVAFVHTARKTPEVVAAFFVGYVICGIFGGVMATAAAMAFAPALVDSLPELILFSGLAGLITSISLTGTNLVMRFILKRLGVEVVIGIHRDQRGPE